MHDLERKMVNVDLQAGDEIALLACSDDEMAWGPFVRLTGPVQIEVLTGAQVGMVRSGPRIGTPCRLSPETHDRVWAHLKVDVPVVVSDR